MTRQPEARQSNLFDHATPSAELKPAQKTQLAAALETLLREIAAALANAKHGESASE